MMARFRASALTAAMALCICFSAAAAVKVEGGLIEGTTEEGLTVYRGIPFAAPPAGNLRWRAPQPAAKWEGVLKADHFAPMCMQNMPGAPGKPPGDVRQSEDCLYLNVYPTNTDRVPKTARDLARDSAFGWHTWIWARLQSQTGKSKVFYYYFDQHQDYPADSPRADYGTPHGADVSFVFLHVNPSSKTAAPTDQAISEAMATYRTNFAKRGDPNGEGVPQWDVFSDAHPVLMYFGKTPHPGPVPSEEGLKTLDAFFVWRRTTEGQAAVK